MELRDHSGHTTFITGTNTGLRLQTRQPPSAVGGGAGKSMGGEFDHG
jgi:hypothetical protein